MQNELTVINEQEVLGKDFKVYGTFENPLFLAKDVAEWIEHSDVSTMLRKVDEEEKGTNNVCTLGGKQKAWFLTEDGLYEVLMQSRKPIAKSFKKEVKKILKEIRKTGSYSIQPTLSPMQLCAVTIFDNTASEIDRINALQEFQKISIETGVEQGKSQGMKHLCNNGVVTIPDIMHYVKEEYDYYFDYACDIISTEWSRYLKHMGYLHTVQFRRKDGRGMESKPVYQPTKMFEEMFVEQGMAIIREIDDRGKVEISYTIEIEKFLLSDTFKSTFFEYLNKKFPKVDMIMSA